MSPSDILGTEDEVLDTLREWLRQHEARCLWATDVANVGVLQCHLVRGHDGTGLLLLVQKYCDREGNITGWDVYLPATQGNSVDRTIEALDEYAGGSLNLE